MAPFNYTIFDLMNTDHGDSGQPDSPESGGVDWAVVGGAVAACVIALAALVLAISKNGDRVDVILQRISELLNALTNAFRAIARVAPPLGRGLDTPLPQGTNLTDSFIAAYQARAREARMSYV